MALKRFLILGNIFFKGAQQALVGLQRLLLEKLVFNLKD
jgi:CBS domain containing-hemolysin-like protein